MLTTRPYIDGNDIIQRHYGIRQASWRMRGSLRVRETFNINTVSSVVRRVATRLGFTDLHFHSLRHFAATQLISAGVDPRTAASRLGHANPSMTLRVYAHATSETEQHAAEVGARLLAGPP